jgi:hypothetical protein
MISQLETPFSSGISHCQVWLPESKPVNPILYSWLDNVVYSSRYAHTSLLNDHKKGCCCWWWWW